MQILLSLSGGIGFLTALTGGGDVWAPSIGVSLDPAPTSVVNA